MKLKVSNIKDILLDDKISVYMRGLLFTIILVKEKDSPKLTLAKFKASVNMKEASLPLAKLHQWEYVEWSGYNTYIENLKKKAADPKVEEVITFMNNLYGRKFNPKSEAATKNLRQRLNECSVDDIKRVVANRWEEWKDDAMMCKHLTPTTIFRPSKFDKYLEDVNSTHKGESIIEIKKLNLRHGDEITVEMSDTLIDSEIYNIRTLEIDSNGAQMDNGINNKVYGKELKKALRVQKNKKDNGYLDNFIYLYQKL